MTKSAAPTTTVSRDRKRTAISTGSTAPKKARTADDSQPSKDAETRGGNSAAGNANATDNDEPRVMQPKGSKIARESSARSTGSRKTTCRTEEEEDAELEREGVMLVEESSKAKAPTGKGKGKAVKAKVVEDNTSEEDSEAELGEWTMHCAAWHR